MEKTTELINFSSNFGSRITHTAPDALKKYEKEKLQLRWVQGSQTGPFLNFKARVGEADTFRALITPRTTFYSLQLIVCNSDKIREH